MKHIKIYEDYTDDELSDLIGDLRGVGHHKVDFNIEFKDYPYLKKFILEVINPILKKNENKWSTISSRKCICWSYNY